MFAAWELWMGAALCLAGAEPAAPPAAAGSRYYLVQVRIIEVDEKGRQTLVAQPLLQTTGAATGVTIDPKTGRKFEFHFSSVLDGAPAPLPVVVGDDPSPAKPITTPPIAEPPRALDQKVSIKAVRQPRKDVLREVARQAGLKVVLEPETAATAALQLAAPISFQIDDLPLEEALNRLVEPLRAGYSVQNNLVLIGNDADEATFLEKAPADESAPRLPDAPTSGYRVQVYDVADLVPGGDRQNPDFQPLIERLQSRVLPESWDRRGGAATVRGFASTLSLVVRQDAAGHAAVAKFLAELRRKADESQKTP